MSPDTPAIAPLAHKLATAVTFPPLPPLADLISYFVSGSSGAGLLVGKDGGRGFIRESGMGWSFQVGLVEAPGTLEEAFDVLAAAEYDMGTSLSFFVGTLGIGLMLGGLTLRSVLILIGRALAEVTAVDDAQRG